ncbi:unnamed protein product [Fraxinus pennsylvanica]|uniref:ALOG domain-containing protein n=1 Tax=Fraxinus pennsylvanica TaxID=56036 RepID=A0AAD2AA43_9LAMI|nr:unnamed protein product [Fraxinus pennsylvanica]
MERGKDLTEGSSRSPGGGAGGDSPLSTTPSRYESQKRRDWNTFGQFLKNQRPPVPLPHCNSGHVLEFLRYLDQFGKTKVHLQGCIFFGQPEPPAPCTCPLRQAWGSLDALIGRLRAAYEENGGSQETNPFASGAIRVYLREFIHAIFLIQSMDQRLRLVVDGEDLFRAGKIPSSCFLCGNHQSKPTPHNYE